jgi:hypothetical protein
MAAGLARARGQIRLALELSLDEFWARVLREAAACSTRAQLLLLPQFADVGKSAHDRDAWFGVARATHYHAYDLAPTAAELRTWRDLLSTVSSALNRAYKRASATAVLNGRQASLSQQRCSLIYA